MAAHDQPQTSQPACHELSGYMPYRQEFDYEYENEAEVLISQLTFSEADSADDIGTPSCTATPGPPPHPDPSAECVGRGLTCVWALHSTQAQGPRDLQQQAGQARRA
jgi:hypothetical protein